MFEESFQSELAIGKYSRWACRLDHPTLRAVLWSVGEIGARVTPYFSSTSEVDLPGRSVAARHHSVEVPAFGMDTRRVARALAILVGVTRGRRMSLDAFWEQFPRATFFPDVEPVVRRLPDTTQASGMLQWTARDAAWRGADYGKRFPLRQDVVLVSVDYRRDDAAAAQPVGCFALDTPGLLRHGYAEQEDAATLRTQVIRDGDGCVCVVGSGGRLPLGWPIETSGGKG